MIAYDTVDEAVAIANDTPYGLNAMVVGPKAEAQPLPAELTPATFISMTRRATQQLLSAATVPQASAAKADATG